MSDFLQQRFFLQNKIDTAELKSALEAFVKFARSLKSDEKSEAQLFYRFFCAFGNGGEERIFAGDAFQAKLEEAIAEARNIALCLGPHGLGRWQEVEYRAAYQRSIEIEKLDEEPAPARTEARVIPVLLPGASEKQVPLYARQLHRVDLRASGDARHCGANAKVGAGDRRRERAVGGF